MKRSVTLIVCGLAIVCGTAALVIFLRYFGANPAPAVPSMLQLPAAGSPEFLKMLAGMTGAPVRDGAPVTVLPDGRAFEAALLEAITHATSSIAVTDYAWNEGVFSERIFSALEAAVKRGVMVRVVLDGFGGKNVPQAWVDDLMSVGGEVVYFHPFDLADPFQYDIRDHARIFVVDGSIGFTGGMGLVDYWTASAEGFSTWRDLMFEVHGGMAGDLGNDFEALWKASTTTPLGFHPGIPGTGPVPAGPEASSSRLRYIAMPDIPNNDFQPIHDAFLLTILSARKRLYIECPFVVPDRDILNALEAKARAGVDVRIISPGPITIAPILRSAWHGSYEELLRAGVRLYEYQPSMIHSKIMIADGAWSVFGSANIDDRSESINAESVIGAADPMLAGTLENIFAGDIGKSEEITLSGWLARYGIIDRLTSKFWLLFTRQL